MPVRRCYILPNPRQTLVIAELDTPGQHVVVSHREVFAAGVDPRVAAAELLAGPRSAGADVLCLSELAVYL